MNEVLPFQRARKPEEQQLRRETILAAAAELFDTEGAQGAGLSAIAARAGFTKSNVYRYFESREEVLLSLMIDGFDALTTELAARMPPLPDGDIAGLARLTADGFARQPRLGRLMAILATILETNLSEERIVALKRQLPPMVERVAGAIRTVLPRASLDDCRWAVSMTGTLVAGMWPNLYPGPAAARVMARPEFAGFKPSIEHDLERAIRALLASIAG